ncbi:MAG: glycosyl transferase [Gammaproteobacteria bacterium RBG_16_51_14]|nr:MAG: glycosyl transferase [Gammaproteobacteria bacterium RBG_16_51_14]
MENRVSIILPAKDESEALKILLPRLRKLYPEGQIIVVNDGSSDDTVVVCRANGVEVVSHSYSMGNGAAIKSGARAASGDIFVFMDADGQHDPNNIRHLLEKIHEGFDMVVGARDAASQASLGRGLANFIYNKFAGFIVNHRVADLTSGYRAVRANKFREFLHLYPNGFSYPTTSTMAFFRSGYSVAYISIKAGKRTGNSHIRIVKDGIRFLLILFKVGTLYSPLKIFFPLSAMSFAMGISHYLYTYMTIGRFTNMSALLLMTSVLIFLIGLVSEQITMLLYQRTDGK